MPLGQASHVSLVRTIEVDLEEVFAVDRKVMTNGEATARAQRQVFAAAIVLTEVLADAVRL
jgi:hypothetical protein